MKFPSSYELLQTDDLPEFRCQGTLYRHKKTGARVYHLAAADRENLVAFVFPTPPGDSTGVAHILEHSVLCGSKRYPTKDPFLYLYKSSLNTFLNAMTYPDKTVYPVASTVSKDFTNLLQVYADAVYFPLLKPEVFAQEGHRLEWNDEGGLVRSGVVFNEMKGNYSSSDNVIGDLVQQAVFDQGPYSHDSGGNPKHIPELTYEQFLAFHRTNYHPSRGLVFLYGDQPAAPSLRLLDKHWFRAFSAAPAAPPILPQPRWTEAKSVRGTYPAAKEEEADPGTLALTWLCADATEPERILELDILSEVLMGDAGLLQKALVESGLGQDLSPVSGLQTELRDIGLTVALRGAPESNAGAFEALVWRELKALAAGIPKDLIESVISSYEFGMREIKGSGMGLRFLSRLARGWLHGQDIGDSLRFQFRMDALKARLAAGEPVLENLIRTALLDNPHRALVVCVPDAELQTRDEEQAQEELGRLRIALSATDIEALKRRQQELKDFQELPDAPSAIRKLPELKLSDIPSQVDRVALDWRSLGTGSAGLPQVGLHRAFTNGVLYLDLSFDLGGLSESETLLLPLFQRSLEGLGLRDLSYDLLARELASVTGGLYFRSNTDTALGTRQLVSRFYVRLRMLEARRDQALALLRRVLTETAWSHGARFRELVEEMRNDYQGALVPRGHAYAATRSAQGFSPAGRVSELTNGLTQMEHLVALGNASDDELKLVLGRLAALARRVFRSPALEAVVTGDGGALEPLVVETQGLLAFLDAQPLVASPGATSDALLTAAGSGSSPIIKVIPATVGFVAHTVTGSLSSDPWHAADLVLSHHLRTGFLWEEIRMKGGAYGAFASPNGLEGVMTFATYRDPGLLNSLAAFRAGLESLTTPLPGAELKNTIIGTVSNDLTPRSPAEEAFLALQRRQLGITDAMRQTKREALLGLKATDVTRASARLLEGFDRGTTYILTGRKIADEAVAKEPGRFTLEE
ncbi:MAG: insulinase family protein [Spirochaetales bacterium]